VGFYIRKAIRVGPLRFNISKSGADVSAGITGLRFGTGPRGNYVHMGRGGLTSDRASIRQTDERLSLTFALPSEPVGTFGPMENVDSGSILEMVDTSSGGLLQELNEKRKKSDSFR
jgi:hypothetical protein